MKNNLKINLKNNLIIRLLYIIIYFIIIFNSTNEIKLKQISDENGDPLVLNINYTSPKRDINEMQKFSLEYFRYKNNAKNLIKSYSDTIDLYKNMLNTQTEQIQKLNELTNNNQGIANSLLNHVLQSEKKKEFEPKIINTSNNTSHNTIIENK